MTGASLALLLLCGLWAPVDEPPPIAKLYGEQNWAEVVETWRGSSDPTAELDYYAGMSLARLGKPREAQQALEAGQRKSPLDKRFPVELAGLAFERRDYSSARSLLRRALRLDPQDRYATDFLASVYFLEHNLEAALVYWNRVGRPQIQEILMEPKPALDAVLFDRAISVAPASILALRDLWASEASLDLLGIFPRYQFALEPHGENEQFDLVFRSAERDGWGSTKTEGLISLMRGAPYETIYPEFYNIGHSALSVTSMLRFDPNKLRLLVSAGRPIGRNPKRRFEIYLDGRKENWDFTRTFHGAGAAPTDLALDKLEGGASIRSVVGDAWGWSSAVSLSDRRFAGFGGPDPFFTSGALLKYRAQADHPLLRMPERRLAVESSASGEFGRLFAQGFGAYSKVAGTVDARWFPEALGDRYEVNAGVRSGRIFGAVPLDELFILGLERDNDLPLGAHIGTQGGKKGSAPLGRTYLLVNSGVDRRIYANGFLKIKLGPFLDSGKITDPSGIFGVDRWLWDTGARLKLEILSSVTVAISYGKDLRSGGNSFYATTTR